VSTDIANGHAPDYSVGAVSCIKKRRLPSVPRFLGCYRWHVGCGAMGVWFGRGTGDLPVRKRGETRLRRGYGAASDQTRR